MVSFYYAPLSSPCRAVLMCAKAIGLDLDLKPVNLLAGEHLTPEFKKMNLQHTVPTLDDNGLYLVESRAIMSYLADAYAPNDSLYPKDLKKRALVNQKLDFDLGTLYRALMNAYYPIFQIKKKPEALYLERFDAALGFLEAYLTVTKYVAGDSITIADFTVMATLATTESVGHDLSKFPKVVEYYAKCKKEIKDYKETNQDGADDFGNFVREALKSAE